MTVEYVTGDLFDYAGRAALAHGANAAGVMGKGIAPEFRKRWPAMYDRYRHECRTGILTLGKVMPWRDPTTGQVIYNLATQDRPGPHASLDAIESTVTFMVDHAQTYSIGHIALPRIGAGIGGLAWSEVKAVIEQVAGPSTVKVIIVTLPSGHTSTRR